MKKLIFSDISYNNGEAMVYLGAGINIARIMVRLSNVEGAGTVILRYAQSDVLDTLLLYAERPAVEDVIFAKITPICATHIFIQLKDTTAKIESVIAYEYEEEEAQGPTYPHFFDTDLGATYSLDTVTVSANTDGQLFYTVYSSTDNQNYSFLAEKKGGTPKADTFDCKGTEARYLRVLVTYHSKNPYVPTPELTFTGHRLENKVAVPRPICVPDFEDTPYSAPIDESETISYIFGIVERRLGKLYKDWFTFGLLPKKEYDYFTICQQNEKIRIEGNSGISIAAGLNYYLKYYCHVHISQVGDQVKMPPKPISVPKKVYMETKAHTRFAYNPCTHSYTMAFWNEDQWQKEIDFLALSGVNAVLDLTATEEIWRRFLGKLGYPHAEIKNYLSGPAYYAWQWIGNQMGQGGPLHDSWFAHRTETARKNHRIMRALGMEVVLPGYSGTIPNNIEKYDSEVRIIPQGTWCSFIRPALLRPDHPCFERYATLYYDTLEKVFGKNRYFTDALFHEGGNRADLSERAVAAHMVNILQKVHPDAVWVITSWQRNPTSELLAGIDKDKKKHILVLDLYGEKAPNYKNGAKENPNHGYSPEFDGTPFVLCMLNNFGGRVGLHGHLDNMINGIPAALNDAKNCVGIGMTPEASENNPVLYDLLFDCIWQKDAAKPLEPINVDRWLSEYAERRYGVKNRSAEDVWCILADTVYKAEYNMKGQGAPEAVTNARPALTLQAASAWGNAVIDYDKNKLIEAERLLSSIYEDAKQSEGYLYDLSALSVQVMANAAQDIHTEMADAFRRGDIASFTEASDRFLKTIKKMDKMADVSPYFRFKRWTDMAEMLAEGSDDFTKRIFLYNARALVTTWGSYHPSEVGRLHDYSNRTWSGLLSTIYYDRWERWIADRKKALQGEKTEPIDWFEMEWLWIWS